MRTSIMGNYGTGPGIRCLATLVLLHHFGRPLFWLKTRINGQHAIKARISLLRGWRLRA